jgi:hypothetical protein
MTDEKVYKDSFEHDISIIKDMGFTGRGHMLNCLMSMGRVQHVFKG